MMKSEDHIETLFADEDLPDLSQEKTLPVIPLVPIKDYPDQDPAERRSFNRADIADRKLELRFASGSQFARQYIENISLGGVFVRTNEKRSMGELLSIEFSIPVEDGTRQFQFKAKVCRVSPEGLGLEFIGMAQRTQDELEAFVKAVLPKNLPVIAKPKSTTIDRLSRIRAKRALISEEQKVFWQKCALVLLLLFINGLLVHDSIQDNINAQAFKNQIVRVDGKDVPIKNVRAIKKDQDNNWSLILSDNSELRVNPDQIDQQLPAYLQHTVHLLQSTPPLKEIRRSKNTNGLTDLHR